MERWVNGKAEYKNERIRKEQEDKLMEEAQINRWRKKTTERGQCFNKTFLGIYGL